MLAVAQIIIRCAISICLFALKSWIVMYMPVFCSYNMMVSGAKNLMIFINGPLLLNLKCFSRNDHDLDDDTTSTSAVDPVSTPGPSQTNQPEKPQLHHQTGISFTSYHHYLLHLKWSLLLDNTWRNLNVQSSLRLSTTAWRYTYSKENKALVHLCHLCFWSSNKVFKLKWKQQCVYSQIKQHNYHCTMKLLDVPVVVIAYSKVCAHLCIKVQRRIALSHEYEVMRQ